MFRDRFSHLDLETLPLDALPGRYCVARPFLLNGHSKLNVDDLLLDDGSGVIRVNGEDIRLATMSATDEESADRDLCESAILSISHALLNDVLPVSPVLPSSLLHQFELGELEMNLEETLQAGHLHAISDRPKIDLRYDDMVAPVARVRRMAGGALVHLASHSDCWQRRTLGGIHPRRILGRFSEDDHAIYENRLYKSLLDRLDRYISRRLARIASVRRRLQEALDFQNSENVYYLLREDICTLWGEAFSDISLISSRLDAGVRSLLRIRRMQRDIRGLRQKGLYKHLDGVSEVSLHLHRTNILNHDPHYRHLPRLWDQVRHEEGGLQVSPEDKPERSRRLQKAYSDYIGLVLRKSLEKYGFFSSGGAEEFRWAGSLFSVIRTGLDWVLTEGEGKRSLRFIPMAWFGDIVADNLHVDDGCFVCWPGNTGSLSFGRFMRVSPLDLYVVERFGRSLDEWMLKLLVGSYGQKLGPLPRDVKALVDGWSEQFFSHSSTHSSLIAPLDVEKIAVLRNRVGKDCNEKVGGQIMLAVEQMTAMSNLCGCGNAYFGRNGIHGFYCCCNTCGKRWSLGVSDGNMLFEMSPDSAPECSSDQEFAWGGRHWLHFETLPNS